MKATDRHKMRVAELTSSPMDGDGSDDVFYGEFTSGDMGTVAALAQVASEIASKELKKKEDAAAEQKLKAGEPYKMQQAAQAAQQKAAFAQADALTEADPNGPKHRLAAQLAADAQAAQMKAMYLASSTPGGAMVPAGYKPPAPSIFTPKNVAIGLGVLGLLGVVVYAARRK